METVLIAGGTGSIGKKLTSLLLSKNYKVIILTRDTSGQQKRAQLKYALWDIRNGHIDKDAIAEADHIINLAGASIAEKKWTKERKQEIIDSRVRSSKLLIEAIRNTDNHVKTVVNASAIGWYPEDKNPIKPFSEDTPSDHDFLGNVCHRWEDSIQPVKSLGKRLVIIRTGLVLDRNSGVMEAFSRSLKFRIAVRMGRGSQMMSWIHIDDLCHMYSFAIENENMEGPYNAVAPFAISQRRMITTMAEMLYGEGFITTTAPSFALKLAIGIGMAEELVLKSITASSRKIMDAGYMFKYPRIHEALEPLLKGKY